MWSKKDILIFLAGAQTFHTLTHIILGMSNTLPIQFFSITWTTQLNIIAIVLNVIITVGLLWWAHKLDK